MIRNFLCPVMILSMWCFSPCFITRAAADAEQMHPQLLPGDRVLLGTVLEVRSEQVRIDTGEMQPRFVPTGVRKAKGLPDLKAGDRVEITVNDQNLLVDVHLSGEASHHYVVRGQLAGPLKTGHDKAVIRTTDGEEAHLVRPVARSKVASVPIGVNAVFLIDELNRIVDVTYGNLENVHRAAELWQKKTPIKGNMMRIVGTVLKPLHDNTIIIQTESGQRHSFEVRPLVQSRLTTLSKGDAIVLLVDEEKQVTDASFVPGTTK